MKLTPALCVLSTIIAILLLAGATLALGQSGKDIYEFAGGVDGQWPNGAVIFDSSGSLYGVTEEGGLYSSGTVYKLNPPSEAGGPWTKEVLYDFTGGADGADPFAALVLDNTGSLYGVNGYGGALTQCAEGCGTIFQLTPPAVSGDPWTETTIYTFHNELGRIGLTVDAAGALYTAASSYTTNDTYIFKLSPPQTMGGVWTKTVLSNVAFDIVPDLVFDKVGALYGAVWSSIFKLSPPAASGGDWTLRYIYYFSGYNEDPYAGPIFDKSTGHLFGTVPYGGHTGCGGSCGAVYELAESGNVMHEENIYDFTGRRDGFFPMATVTFDSTGALYATSSFGSHFGPGSVIRLTRTQTRAWTETTLWQVIGGNFSGPVSTLVVHDGGLFGTTQRGGSGYGAVFQVDP